MIESLPVKPRSTVVPNIDDPAELRRIRAAAEEVVGDEVARRQMRRLRARFLRKTA